MSYHANPKLSINTTFSEPSSRGEDPKSSGRRASSSFSSTSTSPPFSSPISSSLPSSSSLQSPGALPLLPIDSEQFPLLLESDVEMYKVPGQNVYFVPFAGSPMGNHPAWSAPSTTSPHYQPFPDSTYYPGQPRTYFEDVNGSRNQLYVVPRSGYDSDPEGDKRRSYVSDSDKRSRRNSRSFLGTVVESRPYNAVIDNRQAFRPPPSISPANSSATDESGRSSSYGSNGSGRSVRWTEGLVAPTPEPSMPRPKGYELTAFLYSDD